MLKCYKCNKELPISLGEKISFKEECPKCAADLHCCAMCIYYDTSYYNDCKESNAERVLDKEKNNFCEYFSIGKKDNNSSQGHLDAANALFKD